MERTCQHRTNGKVCGAKATHKVKTARGNTKYLCRKHANKLMKQIATL